MNIITKRNLSLYADRIIEDIKQAEIISFDLEFSGINMDLDHHGSRYDSIEDIYQKGIQTVYNYIPLQFGIALFKFNEEKKLYDCSCFSFPINESSSDGNLFQNDSIRFLSEVNFDFNKCFSEGFRFLPKNTKQIEKKTYLSEDSMQFLKNLEVQLLEFLSTEEKSINIKFPSEFLAELIHKFSFNKLGMKVTFQNTKSL